MWKDQKDNTKYYLVVQLGKRKVSIFIPRLPSCLDSQQRRPIAGWDSLGLVPRRKSPGGLGLSSWTPAWQPLSLNLQEHLPECLMWVQWLTWPRRSAMAERWPKKRPHSNRWAIESSQRAIKQDQLTCALFNSLNKSKVRTTFSPPRSYHHRVDKSCVIAFLWLVLFILHSSVIWGREVVLDPCLAHGKTWWLYGDDNNSKCDLQK